MRETEECEYLKGRFNKTSQNASKPPSTDGLKKVIHSSRVKTGKSPGGQIGHKGVSASYVEESDNIIKKRARECGCGGKITCTNQYKKKQTVHIPSGETFSGAFA
ncbi:MAG: DUF6444 domain-containing protein [Culicoidibacterales bacterium]